MKICYDLHIHSALSPCADDNMTPVNIVAAASASGIEMMAVADHNAVANVAAAMEVGEALGVTVVPAFELQTLEDIHFLCLFEKYRELTDFYNSLKFTNRKNMPSLYGEQLIINSDDEITGREKRLLASAADISEPELLPLIKKYNGIAVPAHIDREANGIIAILGGIPDCYTAVELSADCDDETLEKYKKKYRVICDSDSHTLDTVGENKHIIELTDNSAKALLCYIIGE